MKGKFQARLSTAEARTHKVDEKLTNTQLQIDNLEKRIFEQNDIISSYDKWLTMFRWVCFTIGTFIVLTAGGFNYLARVLHGTSSGFSFNYSPHFGWIQLGGLLVGSALILVGTYSWKK